MRAGKNAIVFLARETTTTLPLHTLRKIPRKNSGVTRRAAPSFQSPSCRTSRTGDDVQRSATQRKSARYATFAQHLDMSWTTRQGKVVGGCSAGSSRLLAEGGGLYRLTCGGRSSLSVPSPALASTRRAEPYTVCRADGCQQGHKSQRVAKSSRKKEKKSRTHAHTGGGG